MRTPIALVLVALVAGCAAEFDQVGIYTEWDGGGLVKRDVQAPPIDGASADAGDAGQDALGEAEASSPEASAVNEAPAPPEASAEASAPPPSCPGCCNVHDPNDALTYCWTYCGKHGNAVCASDGRCVCN